MNPHFRRGIPNFYREIALFARAVLETLVIMSWVVAFFITVSGVIRLAALWNHPHAMSFASLVEWAGWVVGFFFVSSVFLYRHIVRLGQRL
ncbi:MAG: hypothetical protein ACYDEV_04280 [Acidiferrobacter sp.]